MIGNNLFTEGKLMHDIHGREIHEGDIVAANDWTRGNDNGKMKRSAFKVIGTTPSSTSCNLNVLGFVPAMTSGIQTVTAKETELILKADGTTPHETIGGTSSDVA